VLDQEAAAFHQYRGGGGSREATRLQRTANVAHPGANQDVQVGDGGASDYLSNTRPPSSGTNPGTTSSTPPLLSQMVVR
jgi:hypothetical protein